MKFLFLKSNVFFSFLEFITFRELNELFSDYDQNLIKMGKAAYDAFVKKGTPWYKVKLLKGC